MAELVRDAEGAGPDDLVLEVHRVEDARTVTQRLHVRADAWRAFVGDELPTSATAGDVYEARRDFWDWLADAYAETAPDTPSAGVEDGTRIPDAAWLEEKNREWRPGT